MSAKDKYHELVKTALVKEGWTITDDPLYVPTGGKKTLKVDLGAERLIGAERGTEKIAVEIKSFIGASQLTELYGAIGQFVYYKKVLTVVQPERILYLAIPDDVFEEVFRERFAEEIVQDVEISIITYNIDSQSIILWKK